MPDSESISPDLSLFPAVATGKDDISEKYCVRISLDALARLAALAQAPNGTANSEAQVEKFQELARRFGRADRLLAENLVAADQPAWIFSLL